MKFYFLAFKKGNVLKIKITAIFFYEFVLNIYITDYMIYGHESAFICWRYELNRKDEKKVCRNTNI